RLDPAVAADTLSHTVTVLPPAGWQIANPQNATATDTDAVTPQTDLSVYLSGPGAAALPGSTLTYQLNVTNYGPSNATGVNVAASIGGPGIVSSYLVFAGQAALINPLGEFDNLLASGTGNVSFADSNLSLAANATAVYTIEVVTDPSANGILTASATAS